MRLLTVLLFLAVLLPTPARAGGGDPRTLVLRGRTLSPAGAPLPGARVTTRGSYEASALADDQGRWSMTIALGTPAALAREPFTLEVRADAGGRRLPLAGGGSALTIELSLAQRDGKAIVRARANQANAASGLAIAFEQDAAATAWVAADFGGDTRAAGGDTPVVEEAIVPGFTPPPGTRDAGPRLVRAPAPGAITTPPPPASTTPPAAPAAPAPNADSARAAAKLAAARRADSVAQASRERRAADSLAWIGTKAQRAAERASLRAAERARLDSLAQWRRETRRADSLAWEARRVRPKPLPPPALQTPVASGPVEVPVKGRGRGRTAPAAVESLAVPPAETKPVAAATPEGRPVSREATQRPVAPKPAARKPASPAAAEPNAADRAGADSVASEPAIVIPRQAPARADGSPAPVRVREADAEAWGSRVSGDRVRRIEPFAPRIERSEPDTCACRLRGTVEVAWPGRPQEQSMPVSITLTGPVTQARRVELFMGPPREMWFGPIPCGDYRVDVRALGKLRYGLVTGDRPLVVRCEGSGEIRLVLEPIRR